MPLNVKRQKQIEDYIVDFYIAEAKVVIEIDGSQHELPDNKAKDELRDKRLLGYGITVLRFKNEMVKYAFERVCEEIIDIIQLKTGNAFRYP